MPAQTVTLAGCPVISGAAWMVTVICVTAGLQDGFWPVVVNVSVVVPAETSAADG